MKKDETDVTPEEKGTLAAFQIDKSNKRVETLNAFQFFENGERVYSSNNKPTALDLNVVSKVGSADIDGTLSIRRSLSITGTSGTNPISTLHNVDGLKMSSVEWHRTHDHMRLTKFNVEGTATNHLTLTNETTVSNKPLYEGEHRVYSAAFPPPPTSGGGDGNVNLSNYVLKTTKINDVEIGDGINLTPTILKVVGTTGNHTMDGSLTARTIILSSTQSTNANSAARRDFVETSMNACLPKTGGTITGNLQVDGKIDMGVFTVQRSGNTLQFLV